MKKLSLRLLLLKCMGVLCLVFPLSCHFDTKPVSKPHQFTYNRAEMPVPEKPDFLEGDICVATFREETYGNNYLTVERKKDSVIIITQWGMGGDRSIYDADGLLQYRHSSSCMSSSTDSIAYGFNRVIRMLYQFVYHVGKSPQEGRRHYAADTVLYLFDDKNRIQSKTARNKCKDRIRITSFYYNSAGLKTKEFTRVYNNNLLEVEDSTDFERELKLYYYTGQKLDSALTIKSSYFASPNIWWKVKTVYDNAGRPDSIFTNDKFQFKYEVYTCAEYDFLIKKKH